MKNIYLKIIKIDEVIFFYIITFDAQNNFYFE